MPELHLYLHHDGYPTGAAWRLKAALQVCTRPDDLPVCFQNSQTGCIPLATPDAAADAEYRYWVEFLNCPSAQLQVQAWRRLPGSQSWIPRCGAVPLATFIRRFLPEPG
jgi:hypothetical protein